MPLSSGLLRERLRTTFGSESQETIATNLKMSQGNVSKLLSGAQLPALDTLYTISEKYGVSIDWLLGLSDQKKSLSSEDLSSYSVATEVLTSIAVHGNKIHYNGNGKPTSLEISDPLLKALIKKSLILAKTDRELYNDWKKTKLALFNEKQLIWDDTWRESNISFLASQASLEADWAEVWSQARESEEDYAAMMAGNPGPFGR